MYILIYIDGFFYLDIVQTELCHFEGKIMK